MSQLIFLFGLNLLFDIAARLGGVVVTTTTTIITIRMRMQIRFRIRDRVACLETNKNNKCGVRFVCQWAVKMFYTHTNICSVLHSTHMHTDVLIYVYVMHLLVGTKVCVWMCVYTAQISEVIERNEKQ